MFAVVNGRVLTMEGVDYAKGTVLIRDSKIYKVGENIPVPPGAEVFDASGMTVLPGMIDAHTHMGAYEEAVGEIGEDENEMTDPVTPHLRIIDAINPEDVAFEEARRAGITSVVVAPGSANVIGGEVAAVKTWGKVIDRMIIKNPVGIKIAFGENPKRVYGEQKKTPSTRMGTAALLREALIKAQNYSNKLRLGQKDPDKIPERDIKLEALLPVLDGRLPLRAHAHRADDIMTALRIAREFNADIVIEHCTEGHKVPEELAAAGVPAVVGPTLSSRSKVELKDKTFKTPAVLCRHGVRVALMTDHPVIPIQYLPLCAALAVKDGLPEYEALKAITINAARIANIDDRVGSLAPGKDADIAVFDSSPLDAQAKAKLVMIDGRVVFRE